MQCDDSSERTILTQHPNSRRCGEALCNRRRGKRFLGIIGLQAFPGGKLHNVYALKRSLIALEHYGRRRTGT